MKSVKPGRGPSGMNFIGSLAAIGVGILWTVVAGSMVAQIGGVLWIFPLFGVLFVGVGIAQAVYHFKNATGENRYSAFDITEDGEEPDPLDPKYTAGRRNAPSRAGAGLSRRSAGYCPYCGAPVQSDYAFCRACGKRLPE